MKKETMHKVNILYGSGDIDFADTLAMEAALRFTKLVLTDKPELAAAFKLEYGELAYRKMME